jgi:hypothetical protein
MKSHRWRPARGAAAHARLWQCGVPVLPITSLQLDHQASAARVPPGIARLDEKLGSKGVFGGRSVLVSGSPCTGKNSFAFGNRSPRIGAPRRLAGHTGGCALRISK